MTEQIGKATNFNDILLGFERALPLETLTELGRRPNLVRADVVACYADIRDFTRFVLEDQARGQRLAAEFLREFFTIFHKAVLRETWDLESDDPQQEESSFRQRLRRLIIPRLAKKLGDGVLLVWEIDGLDPETERGLRYAILDIVGYIQEYFYRLLARTKDDNPRLNLGMDIGIGLASGQAWRHDYARGGQIDYSGPPMNLASRLQDQARPKGICVDSDFEPNYLLERAWTGEGEITSVEVSGVDNKVNVWLCTAKPLLLRVPRKNPGSSWAELKALLDQPYVERSKDGSEEGRRRGLSTDDLKTLLKLREQREASFAKGAAERSDANTSGLLDLVAQMEPLTTDGNADAKRFREVGQLFHEQIAFLSGKNPKESEEHAAIVHSLHKWTTENKNYPKTANDLRQMFKEHQEIAQAIVNRLPKDAAKKMEDHLKKHHDRVIETAFGSAHPNTSP